MFHARVSWLLIALTMSMLLLAARPAAPQWTSFSSHDSRNILEGSWQSCREADGRYSERIYDHRVNGVAQFEVHMGPRREFAMFEGVQDAHRGHDSPANLLQPFRVELVDGQAKHRWVIPSLHLALSVVLAGGSRTDCESWFLILQVLDGKSSH